MVELTKETIQLINKIFPESNRAEVIELLKYDCSDNLPLFKGATSERLERVRFAAIKMSEGQMDKLYYAVNLAQVDWRDLLMLTGCGNDVNLHEIWATKALNNE